MSVLYEESRNTARSAWGEHYYSQPGSRSLTFRQPASLLPSLGRLSSLSATQLPSLASLRHPPFLPPSLFLSLSQFPSLSQPASFLSLSQPTFLLRPVFYPPSASLCSLSLPPFLSQPASFSPSFLASLPSLSPSASTHRRPCHARTPTQR